jgi:N-acetylglucosamine kinase-like BadF-type ATPase
LYFYGAGCGTDRMKNFLQELFQVYFINAEVVVFEDTYAAVYATTPPNEKAIVCILGTGSNCSYFDGEKLHQKVQSLGYIIMDDCSGNQFGRQLIRDYYFNKMPKFLSDQFEQNYNLEADVIKHNLYKEPNPNAYMATFAQFLIEHKKQDYCQKVITTQIEIFVENYITQFENYKEVPIHFIGSIAFYLKEELKQIFDKKGHQLGNVLKRPIEGLIRFHTLESK